MMTRFLPILALTALAACSGDGLRYPVETAPASSTSAPMRLRVSTIELRDVVLPDYAEDSQMQLRNADGALVAVEGAQWAAPTAQAITAELARGLDLGSTASVAAEPWPLSEPAQVRLSVRIDRMLAGADGQLQLGGQFAVSSPDLVMREFIERFDIAVPIAADPVTAPALAAAHGAALAQLRDRILTRLSR